MNSRRTPYSLDLINYLSQRDPFAQDHAMRCVALHCVLVDGEVNVDKCKEVDDKVLRSMVGKMRMTTHFRKDPSS